MLVVSAWKGNRVYDPRAGKNCHTTAWVASLCLPGNADLLCVPKQARAFDMFRVVTIHFQADGPSAASRPCV